MLAALLLPLSGCRQADREALRVELGAARAEVCASPRVGWWRRRARSSGEAVTNSLASASGQITVSMSRPSMTIPRPPGGASARLRWKSSRRSRTSGMAATTEAASPADCASLSPSAFPGRDASGSVLQDGRPSSRSQAADDLLRRASQQPSPLAAEAQSSRTSARVGRAESVLTAEAEQDWLDSPFSKMDPAALAGAAPGGSPNKALLNSLGSSMSASI